MRAQALPASWIPEPFKLPSAVCYPLLPVFIPIDRLTENALKRPSCTLGFPQTSISKRCAVQVCLAEIRLTEVCSLEIGVPEACLPEVCLPEVGLAEVCLAEVCLPEVGPPEVGS